MSSSRPSRSWGSIWRWVLRAGRLSEGPLLGDLAYGNNTDLRDELHAQALSMCCRSHRRRRCSQRRRSSRCPSEVPLHAGGLQRPRTQTQRPSRSVRSFSRLGEGAFKTVSFRDGSDGKPIHLALRFVRVRSGAPLAPARPQVGKGIDSPRARSG